LTVAANTDASNTKTNVRQAVPFFHVADMEESLRFYTEGIGFEITQKWIVDDRIRWCWLQLDDASLMLQQFPTEGVNSWVPEGKVGDGVSIYFICDDALTIYRDLTARGIAISKPVVGNGMWETTLRDPDGFRLHFESQTDEPEDTVYSES